MNFRELHSHLKSFSLNYCLQWGLTRQQRDQLQREICTNVENDLDEQLNDQLKDQFYVDFLQEIKIG